MGLVCLVFADCTTEECTVSQEGRLEFSKFQIHEVIEQIAKLQSLAGLERMTHLRLAEMRMERAPTEIFFIQAHTLTRLGKDRFAICRV